MAAREEEEWEGLEEVELWPEGTDGLVGNDEEGGTGPPSAVFLLCLFPLFFPLSLSWGEGDREAPLGRYGSSRIAAGDTGRG